MQTAVGPRWTSAHNPKVVIVSLRPHLSACSSGDEAAGGGSPEPPVPWPFPSIIDSIFILENSYDENGQVNKPGCARNPFGFILPVAAWLLLSHLVL